MNEVWSWIAENYKLLVLIAACCLDICLFLIGVFRRKKPVSLEEILLRVPHLVQLAEESIGPGNGEKKKEKVIRCLCDMYEELTGVHVMEYSVIYQQLDNYIEKVLSTPQKKGK